MRGATGRLPGDPAALSTAEDQAEGEFVSKDGKTYASKATSYWQGGDLAEEQGGWGEQVFRLVGGAENGRQRGQWEEILP